MQSFMWMLRAGDQLSFNHMQSLHVSSPEQMTCWHRDLLYSQLDLHEKNIMDTMAFSQGPHRAEIGVGVATIV